MSLKSYDRQHLACFAAGSIQADGSTPITFGCGMTQISTGRYALTLDVSDGLPENQSFSLVTPKGDSSTPRIANIVDTSPFVKDIYVYNNAGALVNTAIEVGLFRSVTS